MEFAVLHHGLAVDCLLGDDGIPVEECDGERIVDGISDEHVEADEDDGLGCGLRTLGDRLGDDDLVETGELDRRLISGIGIADDAVAFGIHG